MSATVPTKWLALLGLLALPTLSGCKTVEAAAQPAAGATDGAPRPAEASQKGRLLFEDAVAAHEEQRKARIFDYPALERRFLEAGQADPSLAEVDFNLGVLAERQGKLAQAKGHYQAALKKRPGFKAAKENLAVLAQNQSDAQTAASLFAELAEASPDDAGSRARLAELARQRGELEKAVELAREALFRDPRSLPAYKTILRVALDKKDLSLARLVALRAGRLDARDPDLEYLVGLIALAESEPQRARASFKRAVELQPDFLPAHYQLARLAMEQENFAGAQTHLRKVLQAGGQNVEALLNLAVALRATGKPDEALQLYDQVEKLKPGLPALALNRGLILADQGKPAEALKLLQQYVQASGGDLAVPGNHVVRTLLKEQEEALRLAEETRKMEEEFNKAQAAQAAQQPPAPEAPDKARQDEAQRQEEERKKAQEPAPRPKAKSSGKGAPPKGPPSSPDEPQDGL